DVARLVLARCFANPTYADLAWDAHAHRFDRIVARRHLDNIDIVHAFEYTAQYTFEAAGSRGISRVLALPSTDSRAFEAIRRREEARFPGLRSRYEQHFADRFERRYERRRAEIALADLVIANSEVTKRSHVAAGADPAKIVAVPLAAPPPIANIAR